MIDAAAGRREALTIYGADYPTPDGTRVRDYVHVMDLVDANLRGLDWLIGGRGSRVLNLDTGSVFSVREAIAGCGATMGRTGLPQPPGRREIGLDAGAVDASAHDRRRLVV
jgi:UDP-glucose 4-epimerase